MDTLQDVKARILQEIQSTMDFLGSDIGRLDTKKDPMQTMSFTRGKQAGLNYALGWIESLENNEKQNQKGK